MSADLFASIRRFEEDAKAQAAEVERLRHQLDEDKRIHLAQLEKERQENKHQIELEKLRLKQELDDMRSAFALERKAWDVERAQVSKVKVEFPSVVKLNVQGTIFTTSKSTLESEPQSILALLASGKHLSTAEQPGDTYDGSTLFLDRDPEIFKFIMNWLVYCKSNQETEYAQVFGDITRAQKIQLKLEAQYFRLARLCAVLGVHLGSEEDEKKAPAAVVLKSFKQCDYVRRKLSQKYVDSFILEGCQSAVFCRRDISHLDFSGCTLRSMSLVDCRAVETNFSACHFQSTDFSGADLTGADFMQARFYSCDFTEVGLLNDFFGASFDCCRFPLLWLENPNFVNVTFTDCSFGELFFQRDNKFTFDVQFDDVKTISLEFDTSRSGKRYEHQIKSGTVKVSFLIEAGRVDQDPSFQQTVEVALCRVGKSDVLIPSEMKLKIPKSIPSHLRGWRIVKIY